MVTDISRTFRIANGHSLPTDCVLRFFDSRPDGRDWQVSFSITGIDPQFATGRAIYGVDALQAFLGAIKVARSVLEASREYKEGRLTWMASADLGLSS